MLENEIPDLMGVGNYKDQVKMVEEMTRYEPLPKESDEDFKKFDINKPKYHLIDPHWQEDTAKVLTVGAKKYDENNWKLNKDINRYISALERHLIEIKKGNFHDKETMLQHAVHIACNSMFIHYMLRGEIKNGR